MFPCLPFFFPLFFLLEQQPPSAPRDQIPVDGPSSDFSSIGPSQSASQISYPFPEPATNAGPEILIQPTGEMGLVVAPTMPRRHSAASASTAPTSLYHTPGTQTTYKVETVTYAPAVSVVVPPPSPPMEINAPLASNPSSSSFGIGLPPSIGYASDTEVHTTLHIPAAHAINEYEMPTAKVAESGPTSGSATVMGWRHSRAESQQSLEELGSQPRRMSSLGASAAPAPDPTSGPITNLSHTSSAVNRADGDGGGVGGGEQHKAVPITAVGSALIEVFDEPEDINDDDDDDELPVEAEDRLIEEGKLAVVENPRFMSEERKKELEKEREKWMKQPSSDAEKAQQKPEEPKPGKPLAEPEPERKKGISFLQHHKRASTQDTSGRVTFAQAATPSAPKSSPSKGGETLPYTSPSKTSPSKRFLGSLKGFFGGGSRQSSPEVVTSQVQDSSSSTPSRFREPPRTPFPTVDLNTYHDSDDDDDDDDYPTTTKTRSGFQTFLWGTGGALKKKDAGSTGDGGTRWPTRTDRNIRKLTKGGVGGVGGVGDDDDDEYGTYLSQGVRNNGVAGDIVVKAGLIGGGGGTGSRVVKKRSIETAAPGGGSAVNGGGGGRKKLKKSIPPPIVTAAPPPSTLRHVISSTPQWNDTTTTTSTRDQAHAPANPSTVLRKPSVKTGDAPKRRSASVDESMRRTSNVMVQQGVGQTNPAGGVVDLGKRRRVNSSVTPTMNPPPVAASARGISATTRTPAAAAGTSAVSKGYSSDTAATTRVARAPPTVTPAATATVTSSKPTRQPSVAKTQTHTPTSNPPLVTGGSRHQPHAQPPSQPQPQPPSQPQPQPQPHRQHSASSSGGGAIVLTAGATQPTGTLISMPGWDAQALPTAGGGLSRNNSVLSGVSGVTGGSGGGAGGMGKKKQRQTSLGHGMGSGTSVGRRSSLGSSSGHGGTGGGGGSRPVVQPTPPAQSLMSIIEDVAKHNREWNQESSQLYKNRNRIVSGGGGGLLEKEKKMGPVVEMVDVVKAPRRFGRDELAQLDPTMIKARVMETSTTTTTTNLLSAPAAASGSGGRMVDIKAPGSIFDQRDTATAPAVRPKVYRQPSNSSPELTQRQQQVNLARRSSGTLTDPAATSTPVSRSKRPAKSPLRSAMKNPSRTPSPLTSPFLVQKQQQAIQEGSRLAVKSNDVGPVAVPPAQQSHTPSATAATDIQSTASRATSDSASQRRKGKRQVKGAPDEIVGEEAGESTSTNDTENEIFYTDDDDDEHHDEAVGADNRVVQPMLNGHAVGYAGSSDLSHSTTSTAAHRLPPPTTSPYTQPTATLVARRRKSVRVSLQPTFSPSPPAVEYDDDKEEQPWVWKQDLHRHTTVTSIEGGGGGRQQQQIQVHAPVPVPAGSSLLLNPTHHRQQKVVAAPPEPAHDIWEDSDEDVEYQNAKLLLTRAAKKEKEMKVFAARSRS